LDVVVVDVVVVFAVVVAVVVVGDVVVVDVKSFACMLVVAAANVSPVCRFEEGGGAEDGGVG
jgi:hypothetical protein